MRAFVIIAAVILGYFAYTAGFPSGTLRYRLTVEVMVDGEVYSGSSVIEARFTKQRAWDNSVIGKAKGEAVAIDLGPNGLLFVLLTGTPRQGDTVNPDPETIPVRAFFDTSLGGLDEDTIRSFGQLDRTAVLEPNRLPLMVRFRNLANPKSIERVDPTRLAKYYGPGARVTSAVVETTKEAPAAKIEKLIPWLAELEREGGTLDGSRIRTTNDLAGSIGSGSFIRRRFL